MSKSVIVFDPKNRSYDSLGKLFGSVLAPYSWDEIYTEMFIDSVLASKLVILTGGTDVSPNLYGEIRGKYTQYPDHERDAAEYTLLDLCDRNNIPVIGICRGAQMINVWQGGKLLQHFEGHTSCTHPISLWNKQQIQVVGDHHQVILPTMEATVLGQSDDGVCEILLWKGMLGFQYHPEWMIKDSPAYHTFIHLASELIDGSISGSGYVDVRGTTVRGVQTCRSCGDCQCGGGNK